VLRLASSWVWDFWFADDGDRYHLFFLKASRALLDPDRRHWRASVGHATSTDLIEWVEHEDALVHSDEGAFDDVATWTGSVVRDPNGMWRMFYTGVDRHGRGLVQRIGQASSDDLYVWHKLPVESVVSPDAGVYESLSDHSWPDEAWRDPWVFPDPAGAGWHMLITARARVGAADDRGVVGHAWSPDLREWSVLPPLSEAGSGFGQLEVIQLASIDGANVLLFSCMTQQLSEERRARGEVGGIWAVNVDHPLGPYDIRAAYQLADEHLYVGRAVQARDGSWQLLAFENIGPDGAFIGQITDPMPLHWHDGRLTLGARNEGRP
jgi:beta-fructofuranosidase